MIPIVLSALLLCVTCKEASVFGTLWNVVGQWAIPKRGVITTVEQPFIMRAASAIHVPGALTANWVFAIDGAKNRLYGTTWRNRADTYWTSTPIDGLNSTLPVLSVEAGSYPPDTAYLLNIRTGRVHAFSPAAGRGPLWVSDFVCSKEEGAQHQWLGVSTAAGVVVARCAGGLAVIDLITGHLKLTIKGRTLPLTAPVPFLSSSTVGTWRGGSVVASSLTKGGIVPWSYTHPNPDARITSVAPSASGVVAVTVNATNATNTLTLLSAQGKLLSTFTITPNATQGLTSLSILPTPTIHKGVLFGIATVQNPDPHGIGEPAWMWFPFAVNVSNPLEPVLLWQKQATAGRVLPQKVQISQRMVFVSIHAALFRDSDLMAVRFKATDRNPTVVAPTWCCEGVIISKQSNQNTDPSDTLWAYHALEQDVIPIPRYTDCYCVD